MGILRYMYNLSLGRAHSPRNYVCCDDCNDWFHYECVSLSEDQINQFKEVGSKYQCPKCVVLQASKRTRRTRRPPAIYSPPLN